MRMMAARQVPKDFLPYAVGALLYTPALSETIAGDLCSKKFKRLSSLALCMEDSIQDDSLAAAEENVVNILAAVDRAIQAGEILLEDLPMIFIRVRNPGHFTELIAKVEPFRAIVSGFIAPKFDLTNAEAYRGLMQGLNSSKNEPLYLMPVLESEALLRPGARQYLTELKLALEPIREWTLNIRVGGNDFCNLYGLRRNHRQNIYQIGVVKHALIDIYAVFGATYVVSGPVWEYFGDDEAGDWRIGLERELVLDQLNGFIGKTAIHPSQIEVIERSLAVEEEDYRDAKNILGWSDQRMAVAKSSNGNRMNEAKVHRKWAEKMMALATIYGIRTGR